MGGLLGGLIEGLGTLLPIIGDLELGKVIQRSSDTEAEQSGSLRHRQLCRQNCG